MINRVLLRIKIVQILYSYYKSDSKSLPLAEKELFHSIERTYDLYFHLLQLSVEITRYASSRIETKRNKLLPSEEDLCPNTRFIDNSFVAQLSTNVQFNDYLENQKLSWVNSPDVIKELFEEIEACSFYTDYLSAEIVNAAADKDIWRKIFKKVILSNESLDEVIENESVYWVDSIEIIISFIKIWIRRN